MSAPAGILAGLRVVEVSAFIAAPLGGMTLAQLGADVIRIDPIGGNIDIGRWPLAPGRQQPLLGEPQQGQAVGVPGAEHARGAGIGARLICAPGEDGGTLLTNLPSSGWMGYPALAAVRSDLIMLRLTGNADGSAAVDYTVNCASGFPSRDRSRRGPVNHVLPAWDVAAGLYLATGYSPRSAPGGGPDAGRRSRWRCRTSCSRPSRTLGYVADVQVNGAVRPPLGNDLYGAFGRDFATADGRRIMVTAISNRQWRAIGKATGLASQLAMIGPMLEVDMNTEGGRFEARAAIAAVLEPWFGRHSLAEIRTASRAAACCGGHTRISAELVHEDARCSVANPLFGMIDQPGAGPILANAAPLGFGRDGRQPPRPAPRLGEDTEAVLIEILGLSGAQYGRLHDAGIVAVTRMNASWHCWSSAVRA
jgi:2-methylfumaryl-CoA isomerase